MVEQVVIILHNTLMASGVRQLILDTHGVSAHIARDIDELQSLPADAIDLIVTDAQHFVEHLKLFLPRKSHTLVLVEQQSVNDGEVHMVDVSQGDTALLDALSNVIGGKSSGQEQAGILSQRETDVLRLVASGMINKQIADTLNISINTVLTHRKNITAKLGIKSVSGLSFYAMMNGIIAPR